MVYNDNIDRFPATIIIITIPQTHSHTHVTAHMSCMARALCKQRLREIKCVYLFECVYILCAYVFACAPFDTRIILLPQPDTQKSTKPKPTTN